MSTQLGSNSLLSCDWFRKLLNITLRLSSQANIYIDVRTRKGKLFIEKCHLLGAAGKSIFSKYNLSVLYYNFLLFVYLLFFLNILLPFFSFSFFFVCNLFFLSFFLFFVCIFFFLSLFLCAISPFLSHLSFSFLFYSLSLFINFLLSFLLFLHFHFFLFFL